MRAQSQHQSIITDTRNLLARPRRVCAANQTRRTCVHALSIRRGRTKWRHRDHVNPQTCRQPQPQRHNPCSRPHSRAVVAINSFSPNDRSDGRREGRMTLSRLSHTRAIRAVMPNNVTTHNASLQPVAAYNSRVYAARARRVVPCATLNSRHLSRFVNEGNCVRGGDQFSYTLAVSALS